MLVYYFILISIYFIQKVELKRNEGVEKETEEVGMKIVD